LPAKRSAIGLKAPAKAPAKKMPKKEPRRPVLPLQKESQTQSDQTETEQES